MLGIKINSSWIDIEDNTAVNFNIIMPPFDRESFERVYTFPFKVPMTPHNKSVFGYRHRLDAGQQLIFSAEIYLMGLQFQVGDAIITNITPTDIDVVFKNRSARIAERLKDIRLQKDVNLTITVGDAFCPDEVWVSDENDSDPFIEWIFQVNEDTFTATIGSLNLLIDAINAEYPGLVEEYPYDDFPDATAILVHSPGCAGVTISTATKPDNTYSNFGFIGEVVINEITRIQSDWDDHLTTAITTPTTHVFPTFRAANFYDNKNAAWKNYINYYTTAGAYAINENLYTTKKWEYAVVPFFFLQSALNYTVQVLGNYSIGGNFFLDEELQDLVVYNNRPLDYIIENVLNTYINVWSLSFQMKNHLPDINGHELFAYTSSMFCLWFKVNGNVIEVNTVSSLLDTPIEDWTSKSEQSYRASVPRNEGYRLDYNRQGEDLTSSTQLQTVTSGAGAQQITSQFFSLYSEENATDTITTSPVRTWLMPYTGETGISEEYALSPNTSLRLLFWRGLQPSSYDGSDVDYPLASHLAVNHNDESTGNYTLEWSGAKGLYANFWQRYITLVTQGKEVEKLVNLSVTDLIDLVQYKSIRKKIYHQHGEMVGIVKSVQVKAGINGLSVARVTFIQEP